MVQTNENGLSRTLTRVELLEAVRDTCPVLTRAQSRATFEMALEEVAGAIARGETVRLRSFGTFSVRSKRERVGRNPKTGIEAVIRARRVITFKASPVMIARINEAASRNLRASLSRNDPFGRTT